MKFNGLLTNLDCNGSRFSIIEHNKDYDYYYVEYENDTNIFFYVYDNRIRIYCCGGDVDTIFLNLRK